MVAGVVVDIMLGNYKAFFFFLKKLNIYKPFFKSSIGTSVLGAESH